MNFNVKKYGIFERPRYASDGDTILLHVDGKLVHSENIIKDTIFSCWAYIDGDDFVGYIIGGYTLKVKLLANELINNGT